MCYPAEWGAEGMEPALARLCADAEDAVRKDVNILILTDRDVSPRRDRHPGAARHRRRAPPPGARRPAHALRPRRRDRRRARGAPLRVPRGLRRRGDPPEPRLRHAASTSGTRLPQKVDDKELVKRYIKAIGKGLLKVMSKMGISTYQSYCGAQIFEAVGLDTKFVEQVLHRHALGGRGHRPGRSRGRGRAPAPLAYSRRAALPRRSSTPGGDYAYRTRGEAHMWTPDTIAKLQHATRANNFATYKEYSQLINEQSERLMTLRGLFRHQRCADSPCRSRRSSRPRRSSSASPPAPCRWARSRTRRTARWPSR